MRAVFEFLPSVSEELPLFTGDVIEVLSVLDEFWLLGNKDGVTGKCQGSLLLLHYTIITVRSPKVNQKCLNCPLVAGCYIDSLLNPAP